MTEEERQERLAQLQNERAEAEKELAARAGRQADTKAARARLAAIADAKAERARREQGLT